MDTFKIVINTCYGGFGLSDEAEVMWREVKKVADPEDYYDIQRDDPDLVRIVETLCEKANSRYSELKVVEVPMWLQGKGWTIEEYDGVEHIAERHRTWS
jgi:hypothetical protein